MTAQHEVELTEYETTQIESPPPSERDLALAASLAEQRKLKVTWLHNGEVEITSWSHVGLVRFSSLEVRVVPKLVGGAFRVLQMLDYAAGLNLIRRFDHLRELPDTGISLFDVMCAVLAEEGAGLLRGGLMRDYRPEHDALPALRGRLDHRRQVLNRFGRLDRLECRFDEYDADILENQFVAAGLLSARAKVRDTQIKREVSKTAGVFSTVCQPLVFHADHYVQSLRYNRRNERYRPAHVISAYVLRGLGFEDIYSQSQGQIFTFLLNMNDVFEQFVERLIKDSCAGTSMAVGTQERFGKVIRNLETGRTYSTIRPDLMIRSGDRTFPVDTKYKRYDLRKLSTADIYQTFLYAFVLSRGLPEPRALVIFPSDGPTSGHKLAVRSVQDPQGALVSAIGIDMPRILDELGTKEFATTLQSIRNRLLESFGAQTGS